MCKGMNRVRCLLVTISLLGTAAITLAEPFLPLYQGQAYTLHRREANNPVGWSVRMEVVGQKVTLGSHEYFRVQSWNYDNDSQFEDQGYLRSTEEALCLYNPTGEDYVVFQRAASRRTPPRSIVSGRTAWVVTSTRSAKLNETD
ncbi:MAG: hypothetical protein A2Y76_14915 [Planctomycetes bacterium RBG_13_60_9]|nr:MAG: hypothetical protein A2Y76_14915 [Planctomycetes bacterium RBG_13_60_9]